MIVHNEYGTPIDMAAAIELMDNDIREDIAWRGVCMSEQEFFAEYCVQHERKYGEPFELAKSNPSW